MNSSEIQKKHKQEAGHAFQVQFRKKPVEVNSDFKPPITEAGQVPDKYRTSTGQAPDKLKLLDFCRKERSIKEMMAFLKLKHRESFSINYIRPLIKDNLIAMTIPDKPKSPKQRYVITATGLEALEAFLKDHETGR